MENLIIKAAELIMKKSGSSNDKPSFGTVIAYYSATGKATIKIDGDEESDGVQYKCLKSCVPVANDRVFFVRTGNTLVIVGVV